MSTREHKLELASLIYHTRPFIFLRRRSPHATTLVLLMRAIGVERADTSRARRVAVVRIGRRGVTAMPTDARRHKVAVAPSSEVGSVFGHPSLRDLWSVPATSRGKVIGSPQLSRLP